MDDDGGRSYSSRAGIEDSDLDSDEADMIMAGIYFGEDVEETSLEESLLELKGQASEVDDGVGPVPNSKSSTTDIRDVGGDSTSSPVSESSPAVASTPSDSAWPSDINEFEVVDVASSSDGSDLEYTQMMDEAFADDTCTDADDSDDDVNPHLSSSFITKSKETSRSKALPSISDDSGSDSDSDLSVKSSPADTINALRGLDNRPMFDDGILVTTGSGMERKDDPWCLNREDRMRSLSGGRSRYYTKKMTCSNCDGEGHGWKHCPKPKKKRPCVKCGQMDHPEWNCPEDICFRCMRPGHRAKDCRYGHGRRGAYEQCQRCMMRGHNAEFCSDLWRQYHHTTTATGELKRGSLRPVKELYCYSCGRKGHLGHECTKNRNQFLLPLLPFVAVYDRSRSAPSTPTHHRVAHRPKHHNARDEQHSRSGKLSRKNWDSTDDGSLSEQAHGDNHLKKKRKKSASLPATDLSTLSGSGKSPKKKNKHLVFDEMEPEPASDVLTVTLDGDSPRKLGKKKKRKHSAIETEGCGDINGDEIPDVYESTAGSKKKKKKNKSRGLFAELEESPVNGIVNTPSDQSMEFHPALTRSPHQVNKQKTPPPTRTFPQFEAKRNTPQQQQHQQRPQQQRKNHHKAPNGSPKQRDGWQKGRKGGNHSANSWQGNGKSVNKDHQAKGRPTSPGGNGFHQRHMNEHGRIISGGGGGAYDGGGKWPKKQSRGFKMSAKGNQVVSSRL